ncbi:hypothetical protein ES705_45027 [subsurface metagenome]
MAQNTDAAACRVRVSAGDFACGVLGETYVDLVQDAMAILGPFESSRFKDFEGDFTVLITDDDDTAFSGTVTNVKLAVIELP